VARNLCLYGFVGRGGTSLYFHNKTCSILHALFRARFCTFNARANVQVLPVPENVPFYCGVKGGEYNLTIFPLKEKRK